MCGMIALVVFIIALIMGVAWAGDLASGLSGLFGVLANIFFIVTIIFAVAAFIIYLLGKDS